MTASADASIAALQGTANSRRCHNALFRQEQLKALHDSLRIKTQEIIAAIEADSNVSHAEATLECALVLSIVKDNYKSIDPAKELETEHRATRGQNHTSRSQPWGVAYIQADLSHSPFFSVIVPLSAALTAGNCVALRVSTFALNYPNTLATLNLILV
jgi:acyl-CoA reductase-like NAD-dependent aldehyde dehydrogenase